MNSAIFTGLAKFENLALDSLVEMGSNGMTRRFAGDDSGAPYNFIMQPVTKN